MFVTNAKGNIIPSRESILRVRDKVIGLLVTESVLIDFWKLETT